MLPKISAPGLLTEALTALEDLCQCWLEIQFEQALEEAEGKAAEQRQECREPLRLIACRKKSIKESA